MSKIKEALHDEIEAREWVDEEGRMWKEVGHYKCHHCDGRGHRHYIKFMGRTNEQV